MKLLVDDANIEVIKKMYEFYPVDGVTTNPSILYKTGKDPIEVIKEIREFIHDDLLFVQAVPLDAKGMIEDAKRIIEIAGKDTIVKIPSTKEGFKAIKALKQEGIKTCGTVVYTAMQGYLAAKAGASYVAPYVNRIDNMGYDGVAVAKQIHDILTKQNLDCMVLAASFKNSQQVLDLCQYGIGSATASGDVIEGFVKNAAIDSAADAFVNDFVKLTNKHSMCEL